MEGVNAPRAAKQAGFSPKWASIIAQRILQIPIDFDELYRKRDELADPLPSAPPLWLNFRSDEAHRSSDVSLPQQDVTPGQTEQPEHLKKGIVSERADAKRWGNAGTRLAGCTHSLIYT